MKKLLIVSAVAVIGALSLGSAATLLVNGGSVQAGADTTLACDTDGVDVSYTLAFTAGVYNITDVTVDNIDAACTTTPATNLTVDLTSGGTSVATASQAITGTTETLSVTPVDASTVDDVHVAIH